uniref:Uncharacterized protein LOC111133360 n=1 Tax=Crassostrea virginica TaxID=6565 RepID=A0A8B8EBA9_CRAVI|nr:uncharacterized protein LOC111133360 [Crassostrea virginica]
MFSRRKIDQDDTCHCEDCANYRFYIENRSLKNRSISKVKKCQNDSFHETSVVTNIYSSFDLQPTLVEVPPHPISEGPSTTSSFKLSLSTGDIFTSTDLYVDPRIGKTRSDPGFSNTDLCSCPKPENRPIVYVSFAHGSKTHENEVAKLCEMCHEAGFTVKCDNYRALQEQGELNILQWRDQNFQRASFVLFCISPAYNEIIRSVDDGYLASAQESDHDKGVLYIYRQAQSELVDNCSIDMRFFIVLFSKSGNSLRVPPCFSPYAKFKFPKESESLSNALQRRYKKLKKG